MVGIDRIKGIDYLIPIRFLSAYQTYSGDVRSNAVLYKYSALMRCICVILQLKKPDRHLELVLPRVIPASS